VGRMGPRNYELDGSADWGNFDGGYGANHCSNEWGECSIAVPVTWPISKSLLYFSLLLL